MSLLDTVQRIFFDTKQEVIVKMYDKSLLFQKGGMSASPRVFGVTWFDQGTRCSCFPEVTCRNAHRELFVGSCPTGCEERLSILLPLYFSYFPHPHHCAHLSPHWFCLSYFLRTLIVCSYLHCALCARLLISSLRPFPFVLSNVPGELLQTPTQTIPLSSRLTLWHQSQGCHTLLHTTSLLLIHPSLILPRQPQCTVCRPQKSLLSCQFGMFSQTRPLPRMFFLLVFFHFFEPSLDTNVVGQWSVSCQLYFK